MIKNDEINCGNCGPLRNTPSCYSTCEHFARRKARDAAIKEAKRLDAAAQYGIDHAKSSLNRAAKRKRK